MRRIIIAIAIVAVVAVAGFFGAQSFQGSSSEPTPTAVPIAAVQTDLASVVSAEGFVTPARDANLAFTIGGQVTEVLVAEGDRVEAGVVLARLDQTDQRAAIMQAEAGVAQAQAGVVQAEAGLAQAQAAIATAQARLAQAQAGPRPEEVGPALAAVESARSRLNQLLAGATPEQIQAAEATLLKAASNVRQAQAEYDKIAWAGNVGETPQALLLESATLDYETALANYNALLRGPTAEDIQVAQAGVAEAEAALARAQLGARPEDIRVAEAGVEEAKTGLQNAQAALVTAEAGLVAAQAGLTAAQNSLADTELVAPFDGTVTNVNLEVGEFVGPGAPVITLGDTSRWYVETDDLSEIDITAVAVGQPVVVTVDAMPGQEFDGTVIDIAPRSEVKRGDVTYTVTIELQNVDGVALRWGMTAFVDIQVE